MKLADLIAQTVVIGGNHMIEVTVTGDVNPPILFKMASLLSNSSYVRRALNDNGYTHDLENGSTQQMLSHAIAVRILEQL
jgi:hypothetical protein